jgi:hypothetical protein
VVNDIFTLSGNYSTQPASGAPSADPQVVSTAITETVELAQKLLNEYTLTTDSPVVVDISNFPAGINVMLVKVTGGKVKIGVTTTDGSLQAIPCDDFLQWICATVPITAIQLTRATGVDGINVKIFVGAAA